MAARRAQHLVYGNGKELRLPLRGDDYRKPRELQALLPSLLSDLRTA